MTEPEIPPPLIASPVIPRPSFADEFYARALDEAESLQEAGRLEGLDKEVALLRHELREMRKKRPKDLRLMLKSVDMLTRAVAARYRISPQKADELSRSLGEVARVLGEQFFPERSDDV